MQELDVWQWSDCLRISGLSGPVTATMLDPDGLFARRLPTALSYSSYIAFHGFCQRRFDLFMADKPAGQGISEWLRSNQSRPATIAFVAYSDLDRHAEFHANATGELARVCRGTAVGLLLETLSPLFFEDIGSLKWFRPSNSTTTPN